MSHVIVLTPGYVESSSLGRVLFHSPNSYPSAEAAFTSLAISMTPLVEEYLWSEDWCPNCDILVQGRFCSECGTKAKKAPPNAELISDFLLGLFAGTSDTWPHIPGEWSPFESLETLLKVPKKNWTEAPECYPENILGERIHFIMGEKK